MYVRWQVKPRTKKSLNVWKSDLLTATLVESRRVNGKPRQQVVAYLGSIREVCAVDPKYVNHQLGFWNRVGEVLDRLANRVSSEERVKIEAKLRERVLVPAPEAVTENIEKWGKWAKQPNTSA